MRVFVTGATGYIGSAVIDELVSAGHSVLGVARTDEGAKALAERGVDVQRGDLTQPETLAAGARACDAVAHTAFIHDFSRFAENAEIERVAVQAMLDVLEGSGKPLVISSGVLLTPKSGEALMETDVGPDFGRTATENMVIAAAERGVRTAAIRLAPTVHSKDDRGFTPILIDAARRTGVAAYIGEGANRWPAVHRLDAARLYRLALEKGSPGARYHAVGDEAVPTREIAGAIGRHLGLPVVSIPAEKAGDQFGFLAMFFGLDAPARADRTRAELGWAPREPGLLAGLATDAYYQSGSKY
ncbi:SDR family oxidoreductase [Phenylobacterium montanum]|uniref:SDR family oxidoreductase n=1 Tax=Phenylobacterium montanum TaxID=2823693 RepID=A0A975FXS5_9CAUL|nr:SDR family oxidoreductase [Caulobacter sp. S6]QUD87433.1 SDR family oxidoreductase [Caulobacter sp. S6]